MYPVAVQEAVRWPSGLRYLSLGTSFNQSLEDVTFPSLVSLTLGASFNQRLQSLGHWVTKEVCTTRGWSWLNIDSNGPILVNCFRWQCQCSSPASIEPCSIGGALHTVWYVLPRFTKDRMASLRYFRDEQHEQLMVCFISRSPPRASCWSGMWSSQTAWRRSPSATTSIKVAVIASSFRYVSR